MTSSDFAALLIAVPLSARVSDKLYELAGLLI